MKEVPHHNPPEWATRLFKYYCRNELSDSILGDLQEQFHLQANAGNLRKARVKYCTNVISFINRHTLKRIENLKTTKVITPLCLRITL